jgi:hypothetical protein
LEVFAWCLRPYFQGEAGSHVKQERAMAFEELKAQIGMLLGGLEDQPEDKHELYELIREKLAQMRAMGMPLPNDLVELEAELEKEFQNDTGEVKG